MKHRGGQICRSILFLTSVLGGGLVDRATVWPIYPRKRAPLPIAQEAGWASLSQGFEPQTLQNLASLHTDYTISAIFWYKWLNLLGKTVKLLLQSKSRSIRSMPQTRVRVILEAYFLRFLYLIKFNVNLLLT
jgi:hypothetical protein